MDFQTKFIFNKVGQIIALCPCSALDGTGSYIQDKVEVYIVAKSQDVSDAESIVRQLNYRRELCGSLETHNGKLTKRLLKSYRSNERMRRELKKLKREKT